MMNEKGSGGARFETNKDDNGKEDVEDEDEHIPWDNGDDDDFLLDFILKVKLLGFFPISHKASS